MEDAIRLGAGDLAGLLGAATPKGFPVWPGNMPVTDAWMIVCTQWNAISLANGQVLWIGLKYGDVDRMLERAEVQLSPEQWAGLRMMERVASAVLNGNRG